MNKISHVVRGVEAPGAYLFLLHELGVGAIVDNILAKHRCRKRRVDFFGIHILNLAIKDEVVARSIQTHRHLAPEQDECKDIAILLLVPEEEGIRVHAIRDGASNNRKPVEHDGRLIGLLEQELLQYVEYDGDQDKGGKARHSKDGIRRFGGEFAQWAGYDSENTHTCGQEKKRDGWKREGGLVEVLKGQSRVYYVVNESPKVGRSGHAIIRTGPPASGGLALDRDG